MQPPLRLKDMKLFMGCVALGRFISKLGDKSLPFFKIMTRSGPFKWTPEAAAAFEELKRYLVSPPILVAPRPREPLRLYLAATPQMASADLVAEREGPAPSRKRVAPPKEAPHSKKATRKPPQEDPPEPQEDPPKDSR